MNVLLAHWGAYVLRLGVDELFPRLGHTVPFLFNAAAADPGLTFSVVLRRYLKAAGFAIIAATPIFRGMETYMPKNPETRAQWSKKLGIDWLRTKCQRVGRWLKNRLRLQTLDQSLSDGMTFHRSIHLPHGRISLPINYWTEAKQTIATGWKYLTTMVMRGVLGVQELLGDDLPGRFPGMNRAKTFLQSWPLNRAISGSFNAMAVRWIAGMRGNGAKVVPDARVTRVAQWTARLAAPLHWISTPIDRLFRVIGRALPDSHGKMGGFALDLTANVGTDVVNAAIFGGLTGSLWALVGPSIIISVFGSWAGNEISQCKRFDIDDRFIYRMVLGVKRSAIYRAICTAPGATQATSYIFQVVGGLASVALAVHWTKDPTDVARPYARDAAAYRTQLSRRVTPSVIDT